MTLPEIAACRHAGRQLALTVGIAGVVLMAWDRVSDAIRIYAPGIPLGTMLFMGLLVIIFTLILLFQVIEDQVHPKSHVLAKAIVTLLALMFVMFVGMAL